LSPNNARKVQNSNTQRCHWPIHQNHDPFDSALTAAAPQQQRSTSSSSTGFGPQHCPREIPNCGSVYSHRVPCSPSAQRAGKRAVALFHGHALSTARFCMSPLWREYG
jgi:hypothetical protein